MSFKNVLLHLGFFTTALTAQTALDVTQIRTTPASEWRVLAVAPDGRVVTLRLGSGLIVNEIDGTIISAPLPPTYRPARYRLTRNAEGNYPLPDLRFSLVHRNGLLQTPEVDYTVLAGAVVPKEPWAETDIVTLNVMPVPSSTLIAGKP